MIATFIAFTSLIMNSLRTKRLGIKLEVKRPKSFVFALKEFMISEVKAMKVAIKVHYPKTFKQAQKMEVTYGK